MTDDVKVLREFETRCERVMNKQTWIPMDLLVPAIDAVRVLSKRMADMIEREGKHRDALFNEIHSQSYDDGWNNALDEAIQGMRERGFMVDADPTVMMLRRLRREPRT